MARYKNAYRDELDNDDEEAERLKAEEEAKREEENKNLNPEEETFKKRYGDLRRYAQQEKEKLDNRIKQLEEQVQAATKKQIQYPKSDEEFNEWATKYPDVVANIKTMIMKSNQELSTEVESKLNKVKDLELKIAKDAAVAELHAAHPDFFNEIRLDPAFHAWVEEEDDWVRKALYENETDAKSAISAIKYYKAVKGKKKSDTRPSPEDDARTVTKTNSSGPAKSSNKMKFSESQVERMSAREYEKNEEAIMEAIRNGEFEYDVTGAAR